ncbi:MAG: hypothetical protein M3Z03_04725, partial [Actinomycetota bacterium]|nr:hypothetical protein [Actinomycetota bacterium]
MAVCDLCNNDMTTGASCVVDTIHREDMAWRLAPFDPASGFARPDGSCGDCGVGPGGHHHVGCDVQRCPYCFGQLISCTCEWTDEDLVVPEPPPQRPPLGAITASMRDRQAAVLRELARWSLERGRPADLDLAALVIDLMA